MKYLTRELMERYGSENDAVVAAADAEWEAVLERYERYLQSIDGDLPEHIRQFNQLLLHDAVVWSIARQGNTLILVMHKDIPPSDIVILTCTLTQEPAIDKEAFPSESRGSIMDFQYDEFELIRQDGRTSFAQSIVFGNGWQISLRFSDVQVTLAAPIYPLAGTMLVPVSDAISAKSA
jgi:Protein of unknown function (DUF4085)